MGLVGLLPGLAQHHEVVRIAHELAGAGLGPGPVEGVQIDVGHKRGDDASNTMANFEFEVALPYLKGEKRGRKVHHSW